MSDYMEQKADALIEAGLNERDRLIKENEQLKKENEALKEELRLERDFLSQCHDKLSGPNGWTNSVVQKVMLEIRERKEGERWKKY